jgi:hypothetical protein
MLSKEEMLGFNWVGVGTASGRCNSKTDVSITKRAAGFGFIFRVPDVNKKLGGDNIQFAFVDDNTIAFRPHPTGYHLNKRTENSTTQDFTVKVNGKYEKMLESFVGHYDLKFDKTFSLYYIQKQPVESVLGK